MKILLMLCDAAQAVDGKLYVLGGGWSITPTPTGPLALAVKAEVPWTHTDRAHDWTLELVDADGRAVVLGEPVRIDGTLEVGRPVGVPVGTPADAVMALSFGPLPLPAGRYEWRLTVAAPDPGGETTMSSVAFQAVAPPD